MGRDVLEVEQVGLDDDFFALGGHSLRAVRMAARLGAAFAVEIPLHELLAQPTVAQVALKVEAARRDGLPRIPDLRPVSREALQVSPASHQVVLARTGKEEVPDGVA